MRFRVEWGRMGWVMGWIVVPLHLCGGTSGRWSSYPQNEISQLNRRSLIFVKQGRRRD